MYAQKVKNLLAKQVTWVQSLGWEDPLEKGMDTHSSILTWRISGTEEPGRLRPQDYKESDTTERITVTFTLSLMCERMNKWGIVKLTKQGDCQTEVMAQSPQ